MLFFKHCSFACILIIIMAASPGNSQTALQRAVPACKFEIAPLYQVLDALARDAEIVFIYSDSLVAGKTVKCRYPNSSLSYALSLILDGSGLDYKEVMPGRIVLVPSQANRKRGEIMGRVMDRQTREPLFYANVFLANTLKGAATDEKGDYLIENIPAGRYDLVVRMMGYEIEIRQIEIASETCSTYHFLMDPKVIQGEKVTVTAAYPREWSRHLKTFKKHFLGRTRNAARCEIANPEVLGFAYNKKTRMFTAQADAPIIIHNRALGYKQVFYLLDFAVRNRRFRRYLGVMRFEEITPDDERNRKKWEKNRIRTFEGSSRHFFMALAQGRIEEEGFKVLNVEVRDEGNFIDGLHSNNPRAYGIYSQYAYKYTSVDQGIKLQTHIKASLDKRDGNYVFARDNMVMQLLSQINQSQYTMTFNDFLEVRYKDRISWIEVLDDYAIFNKWGHLYTPYSLRFSGSWAQEAVADLLPLEYLPDEWNSGEPEK
jgi:hypothetical protein